MIEASKWSVPELLARYELEPQLSDVFVEGSFDKEVLTRAFSNQPTQYTFYEIDVVEISRETLSKHGLTLGNKQRVIALSRELAPIPPDRSVLCLVDKDLDHWFGALEQSDHLRWTIFCSLEGHFLTPELIRDVLVTTGRARISEITVFYKSFTLTLKHLYCLRLADREMTLSLNWVSLKKYLSREGDAVTLDIDRYIVAVLNANSKSNIRGRFTELYLGWYKRLNGDIRMSTHGHDYTDVLAWAMTTYGGNRNFANDLAIRRLFVLLSNSIITFRDELK